MFLLSKLRAKTKKIAPQAKKYSFCFQNLEQKHKNLSKSTLQMRNKYKIISSKKKIIVRKKSDEKKSKMLNSSETSKNGIFGGAKFYD